MNNWLSIPNDALNATGWHLWQRTDLHNGTVYQMTSNIEIVPKSAAGFLTVESLFKTYGVTPAKQLSASPTLH